MDPELAQAIILQHHRSPKQKDREIEVLPDKSTFLSMVNDACGDVVVFRVAIGDGGLIEASFNGQGCAVSQAAASILASQLHGMDPSRGKQLVSNFQQMMGNISPEPDDLGIELPEELWAFSILRHNAARCFCATMAAKLAGGLILAGIRRLEK